MLEKLHQMVHKNLLKVMDIQKHILLETKHIRNLGNLEVATVGKNIQEVQFHHLDVDQHLQQLLLQDMEKITIQEH